MKEYYFAQSSQQIHASIQQTEAILWLISFFGLLLISIVLFFTVLKIKNKTYVFSKFIKTTFYISLISFLFATFLFVYALPSFFRIFSTLNLFFNPFIKFIYEFFTVHSLISLVLIFSPVIFITYFAWKNTSSLQFRYGIIAGYFILSLAMTAATISTTVLITLNAALVP